MNPAHTDTSVTLKELVLRVQQGDGAARERMADLCLPGMRRAIRNTLGSKRREDAKDVLHEAFAELLESLSRLKKSESLISFARSTAAHCAQKFLERYKDERETPCDPLNPASTIGRILDQQEGPDSAAGLLEMNELGARLRNRLFPLLSGVERKIYELHFQEGLSISEVASRLGIRRNLVDQHKFQITKLVLEIGAQMTKSDDYSDPPPLGGL